MRFIMTIIWALLIGSALDYILTSMAGGPFNLTQSIVFSAAVFIAILVLDGVLSTQNKQTR